MPAVIFMFTCFCVRRKMDLAGAHGSTVRSERKIIPYASLIIGKFAGSDSSGLSPQPLQCTDYT